MEICTILVILGILVAVTVQAGVAQSRRDARAAALRGTLKELNVAADRCRLLTDDDTNPGKTSTLGPKEDSLQWYLDHGYLMRPVSLEGITFFEGRWVQETP